MDIDIIEMELNNHDGKNLPIPYMLCEIITVIMSKIKFREIK